MYEYSSLLALLMVAGVPGDRRGRYRVRTLGGFVSTFAVLTMAVAVSFLYVGPAPLVPALNSYWIKIHVRRGDRRVVAVRTGRRRPHDPVPVPGPPGAAAGRDAPARRSRRRSWARRSTWTLRRTSRPTPTSPAAGVDRRAQRRCSAAATLDRMAYRMIAFAFPIWTFAVIAGAIWAQRGVGPVLGLGPEGDVVVHHVGDLRRVPPRARDGGLEGPPRRDHRAGGLRRRCSSRTTW